ncbi:MAG: VWA domain-containing protein [Methanothrix sp.]|uniref:VWA domain-containing protein n=1 Tax=Methanothrix sp. TaxID=90426 RepID=UPI0025D50F4E|nr:VWA domain-containing protein [Methanothrix sp.]MCQ8902857.1 VWA domain-containing protein [Methanothrix sp.]
MYLQRPELLWLVPAVLAAGLLYTKRTPRKLLVITRTLVVCLIIIALANPYTVTTHTKDVSRPRITILSDQTASMEIFDLKVAERLSGRIQDSQLRYFSGESTPLGDRIIQYMPQADSILLVSDGYSNSGRPLRDALLLARSSNVSVFAVEMKPEAKEAGIEISGSNIAVLDGDYPFKIVIRKSGSISGDLVVYADDLEIFRSSLESINESLRISHRFRSTGTHMLRAEIHPDEDHFESNNRYTKAVYVVPKPRVLLLGRSSPLMDVLGDLFDLSTADALPQSLSGYKAVVLDNIKYDPELDRLKDYVAGGGGLVVVGGPDAYELGGYYSTVFERALPVVSSPSLFEGGKVMIMVMDISGSTMAPMRIGESTTYLDYEKSLAIELLRSPELRDARVGVVVFGTKPYVVSQPVPVRNRGVIEESIKSLQTPIGKDETNLDEGLRLAWKIINESRAEADIVVISDGRIEPDKVKGDRVFLNSVDILRKMNATVTLIQVQSYAGSAGRFQEMASLTGATFRPAVYPSSLTVRTPEIEREHEVAENVSGYTLVITDENHYITGDIEINATISGFNDVTPKPGAQRLVALTDGKPIVTAMRYGLGRSVSLATDDGSAWAQPLYAEDNSMLISSMVNWAVGDPRPEKERVESGDGWAGSPLEIYVSSESPPRIGAGARIESTAPGRYTVTIVPESEGVYYVNDYGIAVNYPLEYREFGFNPELRGLIEANGGKIFTEEEAGRSIVEEARRASERLVQERASISWQPLLAALVLFLLEVTIRRLREIRG